MGIYIYNLTNVEFSKNWNGSQSSINSSSFSSLISSASRDNVRSVSSKAFEDPRWLYINRFTILFFCLSNFNF